jgi:uncharacterized protein (TIGR03067 family)
LKNGTRIKPTDLETLQGTWYVASVEVDGEQMPMTGSPTIVVDENRFTSVGMGAPYEGTLEVGEKKTPKTLDLVITGGHAAGIRHRGIYSFDRGRWTICLATVGNKRPRRFATTPGAGLVLQTLERGRGRRRILKPIATPAVAAAPTRARVGFPKAAAPVRSTVLEGEWAMVAAVFNGSPMSDDMVKWCRRVTRGNITTVLAGPRVMLKARFTLDDETHPSKIDYVNLEGSHAGAPQAGIVDLTHDALRICMAAPGRARPEDFSSKLRDGRSYTTWRKTVSA